MKNALLGLLLVFTGAQAQARSMISSQSANLRTFNFAQDSYLAERNIKTGYIAIDYTNSQVILTLLPSSQCPKGAFCTMVMPAPVIVTLPLIDRNVDSCGNVHYTAQEDQRRVDGLNEVIRITDHTRNTCPTFAILPPTSLSYVQEGYERMENREFKFVHTFTAEALR